MSYCLDRVCAQVSRIGIVDRSDALVLRCRVIDAPLNQLIARLLGSGVL